MRKPTTDGPAASMKSADSSEPPPISAVFSSPGVSFAWRRICAAAAVNTGK